MKDEDRERIAALSKKRPGPPPERVLSIAAEIETLMTWIIIAQVATDRFAFDLLLRHAADRIPLEVKITMLGEVIGEHPGLTLYDGLLEDLRSINELRVWVAHSCIFHRAAVSQAGM